MSQPTDQIDRLRVLVDAGIALSVIDKPGHALERFLTTGIDPETHAAIGDLPRGRGILGVLIRDAKPLRLRDIDADARSVAFPRHHPPMKTFLGVPILLRGVAYGNLYLHWHGIAVPNAMDGVPGVTQDPIEPGETFTYEFDAIPAGRNSTGGTFLYHSHFEEDRQVGLGLAGALVIEEPNPVAYDRRAHRDDQRVEPRPVDGRDAAADGDGGLVPELLHADGKSFPATETIKVRRGDRVLLRLAGAGQFEHPMHLHGTDFRVVAKDGHPVREETQINADAIQVAPGERYDIAFTATEPGKWVFHCHIGHHLINNGDDPGGLILVIDVSA